MKHYKRCMLMFFLFLGQIYFLFSAPGEIERFDTDFSLQQRRNNVMKQEVRSKWEQRQREIDRQRFVTRPDEYKAANEIGDEPSFMTDEKFQELSFDEKKKYCENIVKKYDLSLSSDQQNFEIRTALSILKNEENKGYFDIFDDFLIKRIEDYPNKKLDAKAYVQAFNDLNPEYMHFVTADQLKQLFAEYSKLKQEYDEDLKLHDYANDKHSVSRGFRWARIQFRNFNKGEKFNPGNPPVLLSAQQVSAIKPEALKEVVQGTLASRAKQFFTWYGSGIQHLPNTFVENMTEAQAKAALEVGNKILSNKFIFSGNHLEHYFSDAQIVYLNKLVNVKKENEATTKEELKNQFDEVSEIIKNLSDLVQNNNSKFDFTKIKNLNLEYKKVILEQFIKDVKTSNPKITDSELVFKVSDFTNDYINPSLGKNYVVYSQGKVLVFDMDQIDPTESLEKQYQSLVLKNIVPKEINATTLKNIYAKWFVSKIDFTKPFDSQVPTNFEKEFDASLKEAIEAVIKDKIQLYFFHNVRKVDPSFMKYISSQFLTKKTIPQLTGTQITNLSVENLVVLIRSINSTPDIKQIARLSLNSKFVQDPISFDLRYAEYIDKQNIKNYPIDKLEAFTDKDIQDLTVYSIKGLEDFITYRLTLLKMDELKEVAKNAQSIMVKALATKIINTSNDFLARKGQIRKDLLKYVTLEIIQNDSNL